MRRRLPNTQTLIAFEAAARRESFSRAAIDLNLTQGAISRQVQSLEAFLGVALFERAGGRIVLTGAGHGLLLELAPLLDSLEAALAAVRRLPRDAGTPVIATYPTLAARWLVAKKLAFEARPGAPAVRVVTFLSNAAFDAERFDLGILQGEPPWPGLRATYLMAEDLAVVGAPALVGAGGLSLDEIEDLPQLRHRTRPLSFRIWSGSAGRAMPDPLGGPVFERYDMMIEAAVAGHGIGVFPTLLIARELAGGQLVLARPHRARPRAAYHLVTPEAPPERPETAALRRWLLSTGRSG